VELQITLQKKFKEAKDGIRCEIHQGRLKSITCKDNDFSFTFPSVFDESILNYEFKWLRDRDVAARSAA
jgi:hypothetical protein